MQLASAMNNAGLTVPVLGISPDSPEDTQALVSTLESRDIDTHNLVFLQDPEHQVIDRYGLLNPNGWGVPHPAVFVVDQNAQVRYRFVETDYRSRAPAADVVDAVTKLP